MDIFIRNEKSERIWIQIKSTLDSLKKERLITIDEWYDAILFSRKKLDLQRFYGLQTKSNKLYRSFRYIHTVLIHQPSDMEGFFRHNFDEFKSLPD